MEGVEQAVTRIRFPGIRTQILEAIEGLADREYQERVWIRHELPHPGYYDELDLAVHTLFDDSPLLPAPAPGCVGELIYPDEEAPIAHLGEIFGSILEELGDVPDIEYLNHPKWPELVRRAGIVHEIMKRNEEE
ncbi:SCO4402 family protein [Amycolatopsis nigrescens]|uniref:SCO4402 family protein n=1 Tax=Amycolatopsis nigrescens TaxID=381445 RepID=UPI003CCB92DB